VLCRLIISHLTEWLRRPCRTSLQRYLRVRMIQEWILIQNQNSFVLFHRQFDRFRWLRRWVRQWLVYRDPFCRVELFSTEDLPLRVHVGPQASRQGSLPSPEVRGFWVRGSDWTLCLYSWQGCQGISRLLRRRRLASSQVPHLASTNHQQDTFYHTCTHASSSSRDYSMINVIQSQVSVRSHYYEAFVLSAPYTS